MTKHGDALFAQLAEGKELFHHFLRCAQKDNPKIFRFITRGGPCVTDMQTVDEMLSNTYEYTPNAPDSTLIEPGLYFVESPVQPDRQMFIGYAFYATPTDGVETLCLGAYSYVLGEDDIMQLPLYAFYSQSHQTMVMHPRPGASQIDLDTCEWGMSYLLTLVEWTNFLVGVRGVAVKVPSESKGEVRRRLRKKIPSYKFKYLEIGGGDRFYTESSGEKRKDKMGTALHTVCGHIRQFAKGKYCMVTGHMRGDIQFGMVDKHRMVKK